MNKRLKLGFFVLVLAALSLVLTTLKWKVDNPPITDFDLIVRNQFLKSALIESELTRSNIEYSHRLSMQEKKEIASHLWVLKPKATFGASIGHKAIRYGPMNLIVLCDNSNVGYCATNLYHVDAPTIYPLHPASIRYLQRWFAEHAQFEEQHRFS